MATIAIAASISSRSVTSTPDGGGLRLMAKQQQQQQNTAGGGQYRKQTVKLDRSVVDWSYVMRDHYVPPADWWIIHPENTLKQAWDLLLMLCVLIVAISVPLQLPFTSFDTPELDLMMYGLFGTDIILSFLTGYEKWLGHGSRKNVVILNQRMVAWNYLFTWFFMDVIATFPFEFVVAAAIGAGESGDAAAQQAGATQATKTARIGRAGKAVRVLRFMRVIRLVRLFRLRRLNGVMGAIGHFVAVHPAIMRLLQAFVLQLYVCHVLGCLWTWVPFLEAGDMILLPDSWPIARGLDTHMYEEDPARVYSHSIYWAFTTITTVGYGDISAYTPGEMVFSMMTQIVGVTFYGYVVGAINSVLGSVDKRKAAYHKRKMACTSAAGGAEAAAAAAAAAARPVLL